MIPDPSTLPFYLLAIGLFPLDPYLGLLWAGFTFTPFFIDMTASNDPNMSIKIMVYWSIFLVIGTLYRLTGQRRGR